MTDDSPQPFRVHQSGAVADQLRAAVREAAARGDGAEALASARVIERALVWLPPGIGEPAYDLPTMGTVHLGSDGPLMVRYVVNDGRREVYVARYWLLPRLPG